LVFEEGPKKGVSLPQPHKPLETEREGRHGGDGGGAALAPTQPAIPSHNPRPPTPKEREIAATRLHKDLRCSNWRTKGQIEGKQEGTQSTGGAILATWARFRWPRWPEL